jgi:hypothetical protein
LGALSFQALLNKSLLKAMLNPTDMGDPYAWRVWKEMEVSGRGIKKKARNEGKRRQYAVNTTDYQVDI